MAYATNILLMIDLAKNYLLLKAQNAPELVLFSLAAIYLVLLSVGVASVLSRTDRTLVWRIFWSLTVVALPWVGLFVYSVFSVFSSDFAFLKPLGMRKAARIDAAS